MSCNVLDEYITLTQNHILSEHILHQKIGEREYCDSPSPTTGIYFIVFISMLLGEQLRY
jgi:hypothetical protein